MISYAQNLEDVILARCFPDRKTGFYVDVGAGDPIEDSVTKHFYDLGWSGINIDPHRDKFSLLVAERPRDINLQMAISCSVGTATFLQLETWGLSSLKTEARALADSLAEEVKTYEVKTATLAQICEQHAGSRTIDFLKIDVEGAERDVIAGMDFERYPATVVLIEATHPNTQIATHGEWEDLILGAGYSFAYFDGLNRFYIHRSAEALRQCFSTPPNVFDNYKRLAETLYDEQSQVIAGTADTLETQIAEQGRHLQAPRGKTLFDPVLERERLASRALAQAVQSERTARAALSQTVERLRNEAKLNSERILVIEQERAKAEQERAARERLETLRFWNAAKDQREATYLARPTSFTRSLFRRLRLRLAKVSSDDGASLEILERQLGRDGTEALYQQPFHTLDAKTIRLIAASPFWRDVVMPLETNEKSGGLFDPAHYYSSCPEFEDRGAPLRHYILHGAGEGRNPHFLFDGPWYLRNNADVASTGQNPLFHFANFGAREGRSPHPLFDSAWYLKINADVRDAGINPLTHYLRFGAIEGRPPHPLCNSPWYLEQIRETAAPGANPLIQFLAKGAAGDRHPQPSFRRIGGAASDAALVAGEDATSKYRIHDFSPDRSGFAERRKALIICVSHVFPWPPRAGNEYRIGRILDWLSRQGYELLVVVAPLGSGQPSEKQRNEIFSKYHNVVICYRDGRVMTSIKSLNVSFELIDDQYVADIVNRLRRSGQQNTDGPSAAERHWCHAALIGILAEVSKQVDKATYYINYAFMTRFLEFLPRPAYSFVDTHDIFSQKRVKVASFGIQNDLEFSKDDEARMLRRADAIVAIHGEDADELTRLVPGKAVLTAGLDFSFVDAGAPPPRPSILLIAFNNSLNAKGVNDFLRFAWPFIKRAIPDVEFVVAGQVGEAIRYRDPQVKIVGIVDSLEPYYRDARVVVNPAIAGTGLKVKTVESVAYFRPIVTWPNGADGIAHPVLQLCYVVHNWYEFAQKTISLLSADDDIALASSQQASIKRALQADVVYRELGTWLNQLH